MGNVDQVKAKVQAILTEKAPVSIDRDGDFSVPTGSTRVFVRVMAHPNGEATLVSIFAPVLTDVPLTPDLYEYVALNADSLVFGHLALHARDEKGFLLVSYMLLGDYLDGDELLYGAFSVAGAADGLDDDLQKRFGGKRFAD